jgi:hypothetical protein
VGGDIGLFHDIYDELWFDFSWEINLKLLSLNKLINKQHQYGKAGDRCRRLLFL